MAVKAYIGIMGSGKSYEVVTGPILGAIRDGRNVISNIAGLNYPEMVKLLQEEGYTPEILGKLTIVEHEEVLDPYFWRTDKDEASNQVTKIQPGDLVALDEIWRFWDGFKAKDVDGNKKPERVKNFFRMHRHLVHPDTGLTCEVVLITQDLADIDRSVKGIIDQTYQMTKHTALGSDTRYLLEIFARNNLRKKPIRSIQRTYEAKYFTLYKSHSQAKEGSAAAKEVSVDKRGNVFLNARFLYVIPAMLILGIVGFYYLYGFFHPKGKPHEDKQLEVSEPGTPGTQDAPLHQAIDPPAPVAAWRIIGYYQYQGAITLVMRNDAGSTRYVVNPNIRVAGLDIGAVLGSEAFTNWSGAQLAKTQP